MQEWMLRYGHLAAFVLGTAIVAALERAAHRQSGAAE